MRKIYFLTVGIMLAALLCVQPGWTQITTSRVDGVVTDASGGVVSAATVKLINRAYPFRSRSYYMLWFTPCFPPTSCL